MSWSLRLDNDCPHLPAEPDGCLFTFFSLMPNQCRMLQGWSVWGTGCKLKTLPHPLNHPQGREEDARLGRAACFLSMCRRRMWGDRRAMKLDALMLTLHKPVVSASRAILGCHDPLWMRRQVKDSFLFWATEMRRVNVQLAVGLVVAFQWLAAIVVISKLPSALIILLWVSSDPLHSPEAAHVWEKTHDWRSAPSAEPGVPLHTQSLRPFWWSILNQVWVLLSGCVWITLQSHNMGCSSSSWVLTKWILQGIWARASGGCRKRSMALDPVDHSRVEWI
jgi:hypothetical protein